MLYPSNQIAPLCILRLLVVAGISLTLSAFVLEHGFNVAPCTMCWWQRYAHWALTVAAFIGIYKAPKLSLYAVLVISLAGLGIAGWQSLAQLGLMELPAVCEGYGAVVASAGDDLFAALQYAQAAPACDEIGFTIFGLSLAMWNVPVMAGLGILAGFGLIQQKRG